VVEFSPLNPHKCNPQSNAHYYKVIYPHSSYNITEFTIYIYIHIYRQTHTHTQAYMCVCLYVLGTQLTSAVKKWRSTSWRQNKFGNLQVALGMSIQNWKYVRRELCVRTKIRRDLACQNLFLKTFPIPSMWHTMNNVDGVFVSKLPIYKLNKWEKGYNKQQKWHNVYTPRFSLDETSELLSGSLGIIPLVTAPPFLNYSIYKHMFIHHYTSTFVILTKIEDMQEMSVQ
jgi:hypothetical protein